MVSNKNLAWPALLVLLLINTVLLVSAGPQKQCVCSSKTKCKCCQVISLDHKLREVQINGTVCVKIRSLKAKKGFRFAVLWNKKSLVSHRLTTDKVPPFCFATPHIRSLDVCLQFKGLRIRRTRISGCLQFEIDSGASSKVFPSGCFLVRGKARSSNVSSDGNFFKLLRSTRTRQISLKGRLPLKDLKNVMNQTSLAVWMKTAKNTKTLNRILGGKFLSVGKPQSRNTSLSKSVSKCWCSDQLFAMCECCVPITYQNTQHRGCVKVAHVPYSKDMKLSFILDRKLKIKENIPSVTTRRLCTHHKISSGLKVGACIKPLRHPRQHNRNGLCIDIDARKPQFRFKHRVGCVFLLVAWE